MTLFYDLDHVRTVESERVAWERQAREAQEELGRLRNRYCTTEDERNRAWARVDELAAKIRDLEERLLLAGLDPHPKSEAVTALDSILAQLETLPPESLPDTKQAVGPRYWRSVAKGALEACRDRTREWLERPIPEKKGRRKNASH